VPESSEEIADPHNLVLDLWTSGGLIAVLGFCACLVLGFGRILLRRPVEMPRAEEERGELFPSWASLLPAGVGFALAIFAPVLAGTGDFDAVPLILLAGWLLVMAILRRNLGTTAVSGAALCAAAVGLLVHLLDLGGIEMPAIVQLLLVIAALAFVNRGDAGSAKSRPWIPWAIGMIAIAAFLGCAATATLPVLQRRALIVSADQAVVLGGNYKFALSNYAEAAARDPFSAEPHRKSAEAFFSQWQVAADDEKDFAKAVEALKNAMTLDPNDPSLYRRLGEYYEAKFARTREREDAAKAALAFGDAIQRYPNDSATRAKLAFAFSDAGEKDKAQIQAKQALELDRINHEQQHTDRVLSPVLCDRLQQVAQPGR
jgi:tetratricopeptide (TPR) repeat protein